MRSAYLFATAGPTTPEPLRDSRIRERPRIRQRVRRMALPSFRIAGGLPKCSARHHWTPRLTPSVNSTHRTAAVNAALTSSPNEPIALISFDGDLSGSRPTHRLPRPTGSKQQNSFRFADSVKLTKGGHCRHSTRRRIQRISCCPGNSASTRRIPHLGTAPSEGMAAAEMAAHPIRLRRMRIGYRKRRPNELSNSG